MLKTISTVDKDANKLILSYKSPVKSFEPLSEFEKNALKSESTAVVKLNKVQTIYPHTSMSIPIPEKFKSHSEVLIEPLENKSFRKPGVYEVHHGMVKLENSLHISQAMSKDDI